MKHSGVVFRYKKGATFFYHVPALVKLIMLFGLAALAMRLSLAGTAAGIAALILFGFFCGQSVRDQLVNIKPALFYALFLYELTLFGALVGVIRTGVFSPQIFIPTPEAALLALRLVLVMLLSALVFCTTTSVEIKDAVSELEIRIRKLLRRIPGLSHISGKAKFATSLALCLSFIPGIFELWNQLERSWAARGGKNGFYKYMRLLLALIPLSFYSASEKAKALESREV